MPQFAVATFALVFLVDQHGWAAPAAAAFVPVGAEHRARRPGTAPFTG